MSSVGAHISVTSWLAQAEQSTHSLSTKIIPRPIYLSHQFTFQTLGEDYHALIRRYRFDVSGAKIEVSREVETSAFAAETSESFIEVFAPRRHVRRPSSSRRPSGKSRVHVSRNVSVNK